MIQAEKTFSSLIVELNTSKIANNLIKKRIVAGCELHRYKLFDIISQITECFNYYLYKYTDRVCWNAVQCEHYESRHKLDDCDYKNNKFKDFCAACNKTDLKAWAYICEICIKKKNRAQGNYQFKLTLYEQIRELSSLKITLTQSITVTPAII